MVYGEFNYEEWKKFIIKNLDEETIQLQLENVILLKVIKKLIIFKILDI